MKRSLRRLRLAEATVASLERAHIYTCDDFIAKTDLELADILGQSLADSRRTLADAATRIAPISASVSSPSSRTRWSLLPVWLVLSCILDFPLFRRGSCLRSRALCGRALGRWMRRWVEVSLPVQSQRYDTSEHPVERGGASWCCPPHSRTFQKLSSQTHRFYHRQTYSIINS
jgi:hypothetical protein